MKYTLDECNHRRIEQWGGAGIRNEITPYLTCLMCFRRFRRVPGGAYSYEDAPPWDGQCLHLTSFLKPFVSKVGRNNPDRALCTNCGCVVEHPDGPGKWTPVRFYGYVINEVPDGPTGP